MQFRKFFPRMNNKIPNERDDNSILHTINVCDKEISTIAVLHVCRLLVVIFTKKYSGLY